MLKTNDIILFKHGKNDRPVAYSNTGKVILCKHRISYGWAHVISVEERESVYLVKAVNILWDYHSEMDYSEFMELLPRLGFKIGFDMPFVYNRVLLIGSNGNPIYDHTKEHEIFAYNLANNMTIVATTWDNGKRFSSVEVYCPCIDGTSQLNKCRGSHNMAIFELTHLKNHSPLKSCISMVEDVRRGNGGIEWSKSSSISLWNYADIDNISKPENLWNVTIDRILLAPAEVDEIFKNCERMKSVLSKRKNKVTEQTSLFSQ